MKSRFRGILEWTVLAAVLGGAGFAVARAEPLDQAPQYVKFEPIIVPVFIDNRSSGLLSVQVYLESTSSAERAFIEGRRPRLIDAYTDALIRHARVYVDPLAPVDVEAVQSAIHSATADEIEGTAPRVLILEAMAQPA